MHKTPWTSLVFCSFCYLFRAVCVDDCFWCCICCSNRFDWAIPIFPVVFGVLVLVFSVAGQSVAPVLWCCFGTSLASSSNALLSFWHVTLHAVASFRPISDTDRPKSGQVRPQATEAQLTWLGMDSGRSRRHGFTGALSCRKDIASDGCSNRI